MNTNADRSVCTKRSMQDDGEEEDRKKRKEDLEVDTDAEEETVGGEEREREKFICMKKLQATKRANAHQRWCLF